MKKTQKILSLVVVLALALSVCAISASAKEIIASETKTNIITENFDGLSSISTSTNLKDSSGTKTAVPAAVTAGSLEETADGKVLVIGNGSASGRFTVNFDTERSEGLYQVTFKFMTPDTPGSQTMRFYGAGTTSGQTTITSTISNGVEKVGNVTITPGVWYDFEARIDLDNNTFVATIDGETAYTNTNFTSNLGRPFDTTSSGNTGRIIKYDNFVVNQITSQDMISDGVTNVMFEDFSSKTSISTSTKFYDASGSTAFNTNAPACSNVSIVGGRMLVGTVDASGNSTAGGRYILAPAADLTTGTYSLSFDFEVAPTATGSNILLCQISDDSGSATTTITAPLIHYRDGDGIGHIWVNNASAMAITAGQVYNCDITFDVDSKEIVVAINDQVVQRDTLKCTQVGRLLQAGGTSGVAVYYDNIVVNKITKDYEVMNVTKANGEITARFVSNAAPAATFFAAIYENGTLTSLKAISNYTNLEEKVVGTYSADADVEVKFFVWAKKGLMPLTDAE